MLMGCRLLWAIIDSSRLPDLNAYQGHENHEVTVILLDGRGDRIGESAWYVDFFYDRPV